MTVTTGSDPVANPQNQLRAVYAHIYDIDTSGTASLPVVHFAADDRTIAYTFSPAVHRLATSNEDTRQSVHALFENDPNTAITSTENYPIRVTHHNWTPSLALQTTDSLLSELYALPIADITHAEIRFSGTDDRDPIPWQQLSPSAHE